MRRVVKLVVFAAAVPVAALAVLAVMWRGHWRAAERNPATGPSTTKPATTALGTSTAILDRVSIFRQDRTEREDWEVIADAMPPLPRGTAPVLRGVIIDDLGPVGVMEAQNPYGGISTLYLRVGDTVDWNHAKVLEITLDHLRLSRTPAAEGGATWVDIPFGYNVDGQPIPPPATATGPAK